MFGWLVLSVLSSEKVDFYGNVQIFKKMTPPGSHEFGSRDRPYNKGRL